MIRVGSLWSFTTGPAGPAADVGGEWLVVLRHRGLRVWPWLIAWWGGLRA